MKHHISFLSALLVTGLSFFVSAKTPPTKMDYSVEAVPFTLVDILTNSGLPSRRSTGRCRFSIASKNLKNGEE